MIIVLRHDAGVAFPSITGVIITHQHLCNTFPRSTAPAS
jgi:hypothetical protein